MDRLYCAALFSGRGMDKALSFHYHCLHGISASAFLFKINVTKKRGWDKTQHFPFLVFATKNRNRATAQFRFFLCSYERLFLYICPSFFCIKPFSFQVNGFLLSVHVQLRQPSRQ